MTVLSNNTTRILNGLLQQPPTGADGSWVINRNKLPITTTPKQVVHHCYHNNLLVYYTINNYYIKRPETNLKNVNAVNVVDAVDAVKEKSWFKVSLFGGYMTLIQAACLDDAVTAAYRSEGVNNVQSVSYATEEDISWFSSMGGYKNV